MASFVSSYIPTTTATATRSADVASISGSNFSGWYSAAGGSLTTSYRLGAASVNRTIVAFDDGTANNTISIRYASGSQAQYSVAFGGSNVVNLAPSGFSTEGDYKRSVGFATNSFQQSINGAFPSAEDTSGDLAPMSNMFIGMSRTSLEQLSGTIRRLTYWPTRLSNATLQTITQ